MKIRKLLNNNAAVVVDRQGREKVVTGKGLIYGKKTGDKVDEKKVEKIFYLSSDTLNLKFQEILKELPLEQINMVKKIVDEIRLNLGKKLSDAIYVSLADHIHFALTNYEKGISVKNNLLPDIMRFYPEEYELGCRGLKIVLEETGVEFAKDEAGFIALHIVNAETESGPDTQKAYRATKIIEEVLEVIKNFFEIEIEENSLAYYRFINHLRYFSQRIVSGTTFSGDDKDQELLEVLALKYTEAYQCGRNIQTFIRANYDMEIGCEELLYLTIHIQRAVFKEV